MRLWDSIICLCLILSMPEEPSGKIPFRAVLNEVRESWGAILQRAQDGCS